MKKKITILSKSLLLLIFIGGMCMNSSLAAEGNDPSANQDQHSSQSKNSFRDALQQEIEISGTVTNTEGEPLPGVNIVVQGTTIGTTTDMDGNYTIEAPADATLLFSFVGYQEKTIQIEGQQEINVTMEQAITELEEVVAVGYGTREKGRLTGSVSDVSGEQIDEAPAMDNLQKSIQGKMPGLKISDRGGVPGQSSMEMLVRGKSTFGNNSPLIVIDGVPRGSFSNIAASDIESMSVLKDASAAIYGARAANGVILIETKSGQEGTAEISVNSSAGVSTFTRVPEMQSSYQNAIYRNEMAERYGRTVRWSDDDLEKFQSGENPITHPNTDWYEETFRDFAPQTHHNISARGGSENINYFLSGDYLTKGGMYKGGDLSFNRYQIRSNVDAQVSDNLNIGFNLLGRVRRSHESAQSPGSIFHRVQLAKPMLVAEFPNGLPGYGPVGANPIVAVTDEAGWNEQNDKEFESKLSFDYNMDWITQGLNLEGYASYDYSIGDDELFHDLWTVYTYDQEDQEYIEHVGKHTEGQTYSDLDKTNSTTREEFYNIRLHYERSFGDHNFTGFIAYEQNEGYYEYLNGYRRDVISDQKVDLWAASTSGMESHGSSSEWGRVNYFGSIGYDYQRKYLFDFTLRRDGSFNFPEKGRFGTFPSISVGWTISEESFMAATDSWLDNLKLRASWAKMGNDRVPSFQYLTKYGLWSWYPFGAGSPVRYNAFVQANVPNPNITWESARTWNYGFDATMFDDMLTLNLSYFYEKRRDILISRAAEIPDYTGLSLPDENLGKVDNRGIELELEHQNTVGANFRYNLGGNFSYNHNEIVYMAEPKDVPEFREQEGHPMDSWVVYKTDGIFNTQEEVDNTEAKLSGTKPGDIKYVDVNGDGEITGDDRVRRFTSQTPKIQFGFNTGMEYKGFRLNAFWQGQAKAENFISHIRGAHSNLPEYLFTKRWTENNKDAEYPRAYEREDYYNYRMSEFWLYNASFVRLKNLTLSYNLPSELLSNSTFNSVRVYIKGSNLWTLDYISQRTGGDYYDPEMSNAEGKYYPQQTVITAGINLNL
ncbi:MAG: TonB-dependent receptor [Bacteroidales bacterium]|nr:TonB-dependent receptor [Bacteroidales bacterium]